ncbi:MAG TPA: hypothetical protein VGW37_03245 [Terriglobia bacterium]|nr:hypothetical protein [Terriglobia bacterium]
MRSVSLFVLWLAVYPHTTTIRIRAGIGTVEITFDRARVSPLDVRRWFQLSPVVAADNFHLFPEEVDQCPTDDPRYEGCGKGEEVVSLHNTRLTLDSIRKRILGLDPKSYPEDLEEVVLYLRGIQSFGFWVDTQLMRFKETGGSSVLRSRFSGVDPSVVCSAALQQIGRARSGTRAFHLARFQWRNCVWAEERRRIGEYPKAAWEKFLKNHGIEEHYVEQFPDD